MHETIIIIDFLIDNINKDLWTFLQTLIALGTVIVAYIGYIRLLQENRKKQASQITAWLAGIPADPKKKEEECLPAESLLRLEGSGINPPVELAWLDDVFDDIGNYLKKVQPVRKL